ASRDLQGRMGIPVRRCRLQPCALAEPGSVASSVRISGGRSVPVRAREGQQALTEAARIADKPQKTAGNLTEGMALSKFGVFQRPARRQNQINRPGKGTFTLVSYKMSLR